MAPGSMEIISVVFDSMGLHGALEIELDKLGYTERMHEALVTLKRNLEQAQVQTGKGIVVHNPLVAAPKAQAASSGSASSTRTEDPPQGPASKGPRYAQPLPPQVPVQPVQQPVQQQVLVPVQPVQQQEDWHAYEWGDWHAWNEWGQGDSWG